MADKPLVIALCDTCRHNVVCLYRRKVESGERHVIKMIQAEIVPNPEQEADTIQSIKIGVLHCVNYGPRTSAVVGEFKQRPQEEPAPETK